MRALCLQTITDIDNRCCCLLCTLLLKELFGTMLQVILISTINERLTFYSQLLEQLMCFSQPQDPVFLWQQLLKVIDLVVQQQS